MVNYDTLLKKSILGRNILKAKRSSVGSETEVPELQRLKEGCEENVQEIKLQRLAQGQTM